MFWHLFVLGHDYGHRSFSDSPTLNSVVGYAGTCLAFIHPSPLPWM
ncbi:unnamed protein product [Rhodiola kirilowii]